MELRKALSQIEAIHAHVARNEVFRGYRAITMASTAGVALVGAGLYGFAAPTIKAVLQSDGLSSTVAPWQLTSWHIFVAYWVALAVGCFGLCLGDLVLYRQNQRSPVDARRMALTVGQFAPSLLAGATLTILLVYFDSNRVGTTPPRFLPLLPGLWAMIYGLGIFASRPYLPRTIGAVGVFFVIAGGFQLLRIGTATEPDPWGMGLTFALGQSAVALVLYLNLERRPTDG